MLFSRKNKLTDLADQELIDRYRNSKDSRYVGELYKRYTHLIFGVCMKYLKNKEDARDMSMEVFEKLLDVLIQQKVDNFKGWIYMVVKNQCLMKFRHERSHLKSEQLYKEIYRDSVETVDLLHLFSEEDVGFSADSLQEALKNLKPKQKICIELFYLKNLSYADVSEKTGFSLKEVKSNIQNGKRNLKIFLTENHGKN